MLYHLYYLKETLYTHIIPLFHGSCTGTTSTRGCTWCNLECKHSRILRKRHSVSIDTVTPSHFSFTILHNHYRGSVCLLIYGTELPFSLPTIPRQGIAKNLTGTPWPPSIPCYSLMDHVSLKHQISVSRSIMGLVNAYKSVESSQSSVFIQASTTKQLEAGQALQ